MLVGYGQERARDASTPEPILHSMNTHLSTVYPDVDSAAYVWPPAETSVDNDDNDDANSWLKRKINQYCDETLAVLNDDSLSASYKVGYSKAYIKGIKRLIQIHN